jgi:hypothetical protein
MRSVCDALVLVLVPIVDGEGGVDERDYDSQDTEGRRYSVKNTRRLRR